MSTSGEFVVKPIPADKALQRGEPPIRMMGDGHWPADTVDDLLAEDSQYVVEPAVRGWELVDKGWFANAYAMIAWGRPGFEFVVIHGGPIERGTIWFEICPPGYAEAVGAGYDFSRDIKINPHRLLPFLAGHADLPENREWSHERVEFSFVELLDLADECREAVAAAVADPASIARTKREISDWATASNLRRHARNQSRDDELIRFLQLISQGYAPIGDTGLRDAAKQAAGDKPIADWLVDQVLNDPVSPLVRSDMATLRWRLTELAEQSFQGLLR